MWLGIKWLSTYIAIRPGELVQIRVQDIDVENRYIYIHHSKTGETKPVPILNEDIDIVKQLKRSYFFHHENGKGGLKQGQRYGDKYFYKWWKRAYKNLDIEGVDLYAGRRHSSAIALREHFSPEQIKQGTMHQTNKAFERYFRVGANDIRSIYNKTTRTNCNIKVKEKD
ncbi:MAG: tyrosine-type recombinase/integrase [Desulfotalea sp.]